MAKNGKPTATRNSGGQGNQKDQARPGTSESTDGKSSSTSIPYLEVSSTRDGYRRAGMAWNKTVTSVKLSDLTDEQLSQLAADPHLTTAIVEIPLALDGE